jgi:hypothetical protein
MVEHGWRNYYRGCRCPVCRDGVRVHVAEYRARRRGLTAVPAAAGVPNVTPGPATPVGNPTPGACELATLAELESLPAASSHQALAAAALCMARILDNRLALTTQPSACRQLTQVMVLLRRASAPTRGRLAALEMPSRA